MAANAHDAKNVVLAIGSKDSVIDVVAWATAAKYLEERVAPVILVATCESVRRAYGVRRHMARLGLDSAMVSHSLNETEAQTCERVRNCRAVVGVLNEATRLSVELGIPTVIGLCEGESPPKKGIGVLKTCPIEHLVDRLCRGRLNPGWKLKPPLKKAPSPSRMEIAPGAMPQGLIAPLAGRGRRLPWQGNLERKPWDYRITAVIPHLETPEPLRACIDLLRLQTERPYLMVIDTGSSPDVRAELEAMRAEDLEIHTIAAHGYLRSSEAVAAAQDLAMALCRSEFLFCTHADCFLRRRDYLEWLMGLCGAPGSPKSQVQGPIRPVTMAQNGGGVRGGGSNQQSAVSSQQSAMSPAVGYQMSPRGWLTEEWRGMVSHTATLLHMPTMYRIGASWSLERASAEFGLPRSAFSSWPDTETCINLVMRKAGIAPLLIGEEENYKRHVDENVDHVRSFPGSLVYSPEYHERAKEWMEAALAEAKARAAEWRRAEARTGEVRPEPPQSPQAAARARG